MPKNVGFIDRIFRISVGVVLVIIGLYVMGQSVAIAAVLTIAGVLGIATGWMGWCWLYQLLGTTTRTDRRTQSAAKTPK